MTTPMISVVIPVCGQAAPLGQIVEHAISTIEPLDYEYEVVLVIDGDLPVRLAEAQVLAQDHPEVHLLKFERHFGEGAALRAGLIAARGSILVTHPSYFQVKADVIPKLIKEIEEGADLAYAVRQSQRESLFNRIQRWGFNAILRGLMGVRLRDLGSGVRAVRASVGDEVSIHGGFHRFMAVAAVMRGLKVHGVAAELHPEARAMRAHNPLTYCKRVLDLANVFFLTRFVYKPLRFFGFVGSALFVPGFVICTYLSALRIFAGEALAERPLFLLGVLLVALGVQILAIGLLAEVITYSQASRTKPYVVHEVTVREPSGNVTRKI